MKKLSLRTLEVQEMEKIEGADSSAFCKAVYVGDAAWTIGALANWWNPPGWGASIALIAVNGYCTF